MFQSSHYNALASVLHKSFAESPDTWKVVYDQVYTPLVAMLAEDNERFDVTSFAYAVASGERVVRSRAS